MSDEYEPHHWADRLLFSIWRDLFPIDERAMNRRYRGVDLYSRYALWFSIGSAFGCIVRCVTLFLLATLVMLWIRAEPPAASDGLVVVREIHLLSLVPLFTASLVIAGWFSEGILRILLRNRYREFCDFCNWKCGFDGSKAMLSLLAVLAPVSMVITVVLASNYWVVGRGAIRIHALWSAREYNYSDVCGIVQDDVQRNLISGETREKPRSCSIIYFRDGTKVQFATTLFVEDRELHKRWLQWFSQATRIPVSHVARHADFQPTTSSNLIAAQNGQ